MQPDPDHIRLRLAREGLQAIQDITTPVAAVAVSLAFGLFTQVYTLNRKILYIHAESCTISVIGHFILNLIFSVIYFIRYLCEF